MGKLIMGALLMGMIISGCSVEPSEIDKGIAAKMSERLVYFKDARTGLCFAAVASRKTGSTDQSGLGLTQVDCKVCASLLVN